jgi:hypothetical protein
MRVGNSPTASLLLRAAYTKNQMEQSLCDRGIATIDAFLSTIDLTYATLT